jgi:hypothetical protein
MYINVRLYYIVIMAEIIIIYKSYTPQRQAYAKKYYQENKELLLTKQKDYYDITKIEHRKSTEFKERQKEATLRYNKKIKEDPVAIERVRQRRRDYYQKKKDLKNIDTVD